MPTPAWRAISSNDASTPFSAKATAATSISLSRLRRASARSLVGSEDNVFGSAEAKCCSQRKGLDEISQATSLTGGASVYLEGLPLLNPEACGMSCRNILGAVLGEKQI